jgi:hypothetical protein
MQTVDALPDRPTVVGGRALELLTKNFSRRPEDKLEREEITVSARGESRRCCSPPTT